MEYIKRNKIKTPNDAMVVNYWWNTIVKPWEVGFIRKRIAKLYAQGCKVFANVYYKNKGILLAKENV